VILNDWSARDIQQWEYVPLGPFQAKAFATSISPWIVTREALEPFRLRGPAQDPVPLPYLRQAQPNNYDMQLDVALRAAQMNEAANICRTNFKYMYWSSVQQLVHHASSGCAMNVGDLLESVRRLQAGLQSFLSMKRIEARRKNAKAFRLRHSQSLARRRQRLSHPMVRSTIQRLGKTTNSLTRSERLTISMSRRGRTSATAFANFGPLYPLSTNSIFKDGNVPHRLAITRAPPSRS
jgi:hypothetical protein